MSKIQVCLGFNTEAEEAARYYCSVFKDSEMGSVNYYGDNAPMPKGTVLTATFSANGQEFLALNCGPAFQFTGAISLMINCESQVEIDYYWDKMINDGGEAIQCGWLKDKFGVFWQVAPASLAGMMKSGDQAKMDRLMAAVMQMVKLDIAKMERAYRGE
jgi:predicted 3-demethylubiquinone-9 3-methyltransferase (glyoxalase superfamily)